MDSNDITLCEGIVGEAWFNHGKIIKRSFKKTYFDVRDNPVELNIYSNDTRMSIKALESRAKQKGASKFIFPLSIIAYSLQLKEGENFVLAIDTDQKKCNISDKAKKIIKEHAQILSHVLKN